MKVMGEGLNLVFNALWHLGNLWPSLKGQEIKAIQAKMPQN